VTPRGGLAVVPTPPSWLDIPEAPTAACRGEGRSSRGRGHLNSGQRATSRKVAAVGRWVYTPSGCSAPSSVSCASTAFSAGVSCTAGVSDAGLSARRRRKRVALARHAGRCGCLDEGAVRAHARTRRSSSGGGGRCVGHLEVYSGWYRNISIGGGASKQILQDRRPADGADVLSK
jgi:hypothetical protein